MSFFDQIKNARKVLVLDLGFLGDTIHCLPAVYRVRESLPNVELHWMVAEHIRSLLVLTPWVDNVLGYPRFPKGPRWYQDFGRVLKLRRAGYDVVINLNGSDRSSILTGCSGARFRLGRERTNPPAFWKYCYTHVYGYPRGQEPVYRQSCRVLEAAGFPVNEPQFPIVVPDAVNEGIEKELGDLEDFIHVSPFATLDYKELPIPQIAAFLETIWRQAPLVLSCAPNKRELGKLKQLLSLLSFTPEKVFAGTLNLVQLAALINKSKLHAGADSGALHLALVCEKPSVSWFRKYAHAVEWAPQGLQHRVIFGDASDEGLQGIEVEELALAVVALLQQKRGGSR